MSPMVKLPLTLEHALLGFLRQQPMHPYEMHQRLEQAQALGLVWRLKQSQLYALLARLEEAGYIESQVEPQGKRPPRKVMWLTASGRAAFHRWLREPVAHGRDFRIEFLAKLFFAGQEGPETTGALIESQRRACDGWLDSLRTEAQAHASSYDTLVLQFRIGQIEAILDWLDICANTLTPRMAP